jgi:hypothetical protein
MARGDAHAALRQLVVERGFEPRFAGALPHQDRLARRDLEALQQRRVHPAARGARVARLLQRGRAPHQRIRGIDRHVGDAF